MDPVKPYSDNLLIQPVTEIKFSCPLEVVLAGTLSVVKANLVLEVLSSLKVKTCDKTTSYESKFRVFLALPH